LIGNFPIGNETFIIPITPKEAFVFPFENKNNEALVFPNRKNGRQTG
jgi:hypothetical protein